MQHHHHRIHPANCTILAKYESSHPAVRALEAHAEACEACLGKEIHWPGKESAVDHKWFSRTRLKEQSFSALAYEFISYDLILDGWLEMRPEPTEWEYNYLTEDEPLLRALLDECEETAADDNNTKILPLIEKARNYMDTFKDAILYRFTICNIAWPDTGTHDPP